MLLSERDFRQTAFPVAAVVLALATFIPSFVARAGDLSCIQSTGDEAIAACTREIGAAGPQDRQLAPLYLNRGEAYYSRYELGAALADINQAIRLDPQLAAAYDARGRVYHFHPDRALLNFDIAIKLDPQFARALVDRAAAYRLSGDLDRSLADLDQTIRLDPSNTLAYEVLGAVYRDKGEFDGAISAYSEAIARNSRNHFAYFHRGQVYQRLGQFDALRSPITIRRFGSVPRPSFTKRVAALIRRREISKPRSAISMRRSSKTPMMRRLSMPAGSRGLPQVTALAVTPIWPRPNT